MINPLYGYYSTVGVATAGYPTLDTQNCPGIANCQYQLFSLNYALFYWASGNPNGNGFSTSGNIYTKWNALGGPGGTLGMGYSAQATVTSPAKTTANQQLFTSGVVASITSGVNSGNTFAVVEPNYDLYSCFRRRGRPSWPPHFRRRYTGERSSPADLRRRPHRVSGRVRAQRPPGRRSSRPQSARCR